MTKVARRRKDKVDWELRKKAADLAAETIMSQTILRDGAGCEIAAMYAFWREVVNVTIEDYYGAPRAAVGKEDLRVEEARAFIKTKGGEALFNTLGVDPDWCARVIADYLSDLERDYDRRSSDDYEIIHKNPTIRRSNRKRYISLQSSGVSSSAGGAV